MGTGPIFLALLLIGQSSALCRCGQKPHWVTVCKGSVDEFLDCPNDRTLTIDAITDSTGFCKITDWHRLTGEQNPTCSAGQ